MFFLETRQTSSVETGQLFSVGTGQMSAFEAGQMSNIKTWLCPVRPCRELTSLVITGTLPQAFLISLS